METPYNIVNHRREQCEHCPTPCEFQNNAEWRAVGDNACPKGRFMAYKTFTKVKWRGVGDAVAAGIQAGAGAIDKVAGTSLKQKAKGCAACRKRKEMLNQLIPFGGNSNTGM